MTLPSMVFDLQTRVLGPVLVIPKDDLMVSGQAVKQRGEDSFRIGKQLGTERITDRTFDGRGIDCNIAFSL